MVDRRGGVFERVRGPSLPPALRGRVLGAAARSDSRHALGDAARWWTVRAWRWPLAFALAAVLAGHLALTASPAPRLPQVPEESSWRQQLTLVGALDDWARLERALEPGGGASP